MAKIIKVVNFHCCFTSIQLHLFATIQWAHFHWNYYLIGNLPKFGLSSTNKKHFWSHLINRCLSSKESNISLVSSKKKKKSLAWLTEGQMMSPYGPSLLKKGKRFSCSRENMMIGRVKTKVFPDPVKAMPIMSRPDRLHTSTVSS